ncbi:hypothetical protein N7478_008131 [Penicillium angulare]|uniref:uncharacterized protein n=1 Tax=Penicillium angulare TaxID=116970 RepID=UPI00254067FF|nr:uncharacterized protein N7478_008131 [Penicillium angulare]KAJ5273006.1 hypothetical protein N7478_008131 [Penicillium angulare]
MYQSDYQQTRLEILGHLSSTKRAMSSSRLPCEHENNNNNDPLLQLRQVKRLTPPEYKLLKHYIEHTSRDLTVDNQDQYALQIGIPNLALESRPLMKSLLALSAVCKCSDIINQALSPRNCRKRVLSLLNFADQYHMESLREIQATLPKTKHYDHVLANAAMMGMYGSGSHCVRIWLTETASIDGFSVDEIRPRGAQWISFFRAARIAYAGLVGGIRESGSLTRTRDCSAATTLSDARSKLFNQYRPSVPTTSQGSPSAHPLYPIFAETIPSALETLNRRARGLMDLLSTDLIEDRHRPDIHACFAALQIFNDIVSVTFAVKATNSMSPSSFSDAFSDDSGIESIIQNLNVSPWIGRYTANITSMIPSNLPRRFIMALIHKAPSRYLSLVEEMIDIVQSDSDTSLNSTAPNGRWGYGKAEPSFAHQFAFDIFAHWLVLVILLEDVWWIGGIGAWELGQIVSFKRSSRSSMGLWSREGKWWPESMFDISRQFDKHSVYA